MKVSVIISVYQSHEAVHRQMLHFKKMLLPEDVEVIIVDDGSHPPLALYNRPEEQFKLYQTHSDLAWTQGLGRNLGAAHAQGEYLLMTDIDHILSRETIDAVRNFTGNRMYFRRYLGVLLVDGTFTQDNAVLMEYGFDPSLYPSRGLYASVHSNTFAVARKTFEELGGYTPATCTKGYHPGSRDGEDCHFNHRWNRWAAERHILPVQGPDIYMFPVGRYHIRRETNPWGLFHDLSYDTSKQSLKGDEAHA